MQSLKTCVVTVLLLVATAHAEIKSIDITIFGMDWEVCAHAVRVSMKSVPGVDSVKVSLEKGLASVTLKPGNTATLNQLQQAIAKNGFTMKQSNIVVVGTIVLSGDIAKLKVTGSNELLDLEPDAQVTPISPSMANESVAISGIVPERVKGQPPFVLRYSKVEPI